MANTYYLVYTPRARFFLYKENRYVEKNEVHVGTLQGIPTSYDPTESVGDFRTVGEKIATVDDEVVRITAIDWIHPDIDSYEQMAKNLLWGPPQKSE